MYINSYDYWRFLIISDSDIYDFVSTQNKKLINSPSGWSSMCVDYFTFEETGLSQLFSQQKTPSDLRDTKIFKYQLCMQCYTFTTLIKYTLTGHYMHQVYSYFSVLVPIKKKVIILLLFITELLEGSSIVLEWSTSHWKAFVIFCISQVGT